MVATMPETQQERSVRLALRAADAEIALEAARVDLRMFGEALDRARLEVDELRAALRDCIEIAGSDCEHELCKAIIERAKAALSE